MATPRIELKRHYRELSEAETDELVGIVADLIVTFLKGSRESAQPPSAEGSEARQEVLG